MRDIRNPTDVYLLIMEAKTSWNIGILAAADRVEMERTGRAQAAPSLAPRDFADYGPLREEARQNGAQVPLNLSDELGGF